MRDVHTDASIRPAQHRAQALLGPPRLPAGHGGASTASERVITHSVRYRSVSPARQRNRSGWAFRVIRRILRFEPITAVLEGECAHRHHRYPRRAPILHERLPGVRAVHVGEPEVHQDHVGEVHSREPDALRSVRRLERFEARGAQHVSSELPVLLVVVDDQDERPAGSASAWAYPPAMPIRIVLAEDHLIVREGLRRLLEARSDVEVAAACDDLDSLLAAVETERPDVVITDIRMPPGHTDEGIQAAERLRRTDPNVGVVVLSQYATPSYALALLENGSARRAYLLKERIQEPEQLASAIHAVAEGGSVIDPKVVEALVAENSRGEESRLNQLTPRESEVLREMAAGKSNAAIGETLFLAERSVEKVIHSIFLKLGLTWEASVHKRVKAVILYLAESE